MVNINFLLFVDINLKLKVKIDQKKYLNLSFNLVKLVSIFKAKNHQ